MATGNENIKRPNILIVTHVFYTNNSIVTGPFTAVIEALSKNKKYNLSTLELPLNDYINEVVCGSINHTEHIKIPTVFGRFLPVKYLTDFIVTLFSIIQFLWKSKQCEKSIVIGIDPLSTFPAALLRYFLNFKLVYYSVDFNEKRFSNSWLQKTYEFFDKISSVKADQTWVICKALADYKKTHYNTNSIYIPNSSAFNRRYYENNRFDYLSKREGKRTVWKGSILSNKQVDHIVRLAKHIQELRPEMEFWFIPLNKVDLFEQTAIEYNLSNFKIIPVKGEESNKLVAQCDLGLAIYDKDFGSTKYIEPIKVWEYMLSGIPFIISCEPSLSDEIKNSGVALLLTPDNGFPQREKLEAFIQKENLTELRKKCLEIAEKYNASILIPETIAKLFV